MTNPFDWTYLTRVPKAYEAYGLFAIAFASVYLVGLVIVLLLPRWLDRRLREHTLHRRLSVLACRVGAWIFSVGLVFFGFRALELPFLGMRLWLYLTLVAWVVAAGFAVWYALVRYPAAKVRFLAEAARKEYLRPTTPTRRSGSRRRR